jgi:hypothetical protein
MSAWQRGHMQKPLVFDSTLADTYRRDSTAIVYVADGFPGYPCRQCLRDAEEGEELILVSFDPFALASPYRQAGPIFLHRTDCATNRDDSVVPEQLQRRQLSVRAFDTDEMMIDAAVITGDELAEKLERLALNPATAFVDVHNATRGCWAARYCFKARDASINDAAVLGVTVGRLWDISVRRDAPSAASRVVHRSAPIYPIARWKKAGLGPASARPGRLRARCGQSLRMNWSSVTQVSKSPAQSR